MTNATETVTASARLKPETASAPAPHTNKSAQHPEGQEPQQDRHADNATQTPVPLGTEWYADLSPKVTRYIEQRDPQNTRDLYAMLLEVVEHLGTRLGGTS
jgi:hypothetical protein